MNYQKIYNQLIFKAQSENRKKNCGVYFERHHIIPKCLGGSNDKKNLVLLTGREHFLAHWLLHRINPHDSKLAFGFFKCAQINVIDRQFTISSRAYEEARIAYSIALKTRIPWNKGIKTGPNEKLSKSKMGIDPWNKNKKGVQAAWNKDLKGAQSHTFESIEKIKSSLQILYKNKVHHRKGKEPWNKKHKEIA